MSDTEDYRRSDDVLSAPFARDRFAPTRSSSANSDTSYSGDVSMTSADPPSAGGPSYTEHRPPPIEMETAHHSKHELGAPTVSSPASSKSESIDVPTPTDSEKNLMGMVTTLHSTVMGMQSTLSGAYQTMLGNLTQSVQMMQMMHSMMEDFVRRSLLVETHVLPFAHAKESLESGRQVPAGQVSPSTVLLHMQLSNAGHFPVRGLMLNLHFSLPPHTPNLASGLAPSSDIKFQMLSYHMSPQSRVQAELDEMKIANELPQVATIDSEIPVIKTPISLNPGSSLTLRVLMTPPRFARFNGSMAISFPSPGTAQSLSVQHRFGVYLLHQCQMQFFPSGAVPAEVAALIPSDSDPAHTARLSAVALRSIFRVAPLYGVCPGSVFSLTGPAPAGATVVFRVEAPDGDNHVRVRFVESHPAAFAARDVVEETEKMANYFVNSNHGHW